jgi:hypothetical protein
MLWREGMARGDLSRKITVPIQGVVMVQLKDVINTMVDKLGQFAKEVTRVSQEVGTEGYVIFFFFVFLLSTFVSAYFIFLTLPFSPWIFPFSHSPFSQPPRSFLLQGFLRSP